MAIRRPGISSPTWLFQDFLYYEDSPEELRYLVVKWDGEPFERVSETFDYSNPPYSDEDQKGGSIVARIDYTLEGYLITIDSWETNWRDEWPLRLAANYLQNCKYRSEQGYVIQVPKDAYSFWVSEYFRPYSNDPYTNLYS
jgi:hypothetical protein